MGRTHGFLLAGFAAVAVGLAVLAGIAMLGSGLGDAVWPGPARTSQPPGLLVVDPGRGGAPAPGAPAGPPRDRVDAGAAAPAPPLVIGTTGAGAGARNGAGPALATSPRWQDRARTRHTTKRTPSKKAPAPSTGGGSPAAPATPVAGAAPGARAAAPPRAPRVTAPVVTPPTPPATTPHDNGHGHGHGRGQSGGQ